MAKEVIELFEDRVIIRQIDGDKKSPGGIYIPETAQEKPTKGIIVDCGKMENGLKVGDKVLFGKYAGSEITLNGEELLVMREKDVMGLLKEVEELPDLYKSKS